MAATEPDLRQQPEKDFAKKGSAFPTIELAAYLTKVGLTQDELIHLSPVERLNSIYTAHISTFSYSNVKLRLAAWQPGSIRCGDTYRMKIIKAHFLRLSVVIAFNRLQYCTRY